MKNEDRMVREMGGSDLVDIERDRVRCPACGGMSGLVGGPVFRLAEHSQPPRVEQSGEPPADETSAYQIDVVQSGPCRAVGHGVDLSKVLRLRMPLSPILSEYERRAGKQVRSALDREAYMAHGAGLALPDEERQGMHVPSAGDYARSADVNAELVRIDRLLSGSSMEALRAKIIGVSDRHVGKLHALGAAWAEFDPAGDEPKPVTLWAIGMYGTVFGAWVKARRSSREGAAHIILSGWRRQRRIQLAKADVAHQAEGKP